MWRPALLSLALHEMLDQHRQILEPLAQRRHLHGEHVQAVEQILAEASGADGGVEVAMRRRDDAHVAANRAIAADALEASLLQHPQQLHLHLQRHVADFIEEQACRLRRTRSGPAASTARR